MRANKSIGDVTVASSIILYSLWFLPSTNWLVSCYILHYVRQLVANFVEGLVLSWWVFTSFSQLIRAVRVNQNSQDQNNELRGAQRFHRAEGNCRFAWCVRKILIIAAKVCNCYRHVWTGKLTRPLSLDRPQSVELVTFNPWGKWCLLKAAK